MSNYWAKIVARLYKNGKINTEDLDKAVLKEMISEEEKQEILKSIQIEEIVEEIQDSNKEIIIEETTEETENTNEEVIEEETEIENDITEEIIETEITEENT